MHLILRQIPKVDDMLAHPAFDGEGGHLLLQATRTVLARLREDILNSTLTEVPDTDVLVQAVFSELAVLRKSSLRRVINGTGVILHTNLGRAPLAKEALAAVTEGARGYSNLEYEIPSAQRGSRHVHVEDLLTRLTGARAAMVVNNNAAAVLLALSALASQRDVITSRGELVEIGGSFRIPDVCLQSGCRLVEVGATNKTHLWDYAEAVDKSGNAPPGAILRVHASNFKMHGFVSRPALVDLATLAQERGVVLIEDLGSGALLDLALYNGPAHETVSQSIVAGVDIVTFSGDKLLGGPQAGLIVGRADLIAKMKAHPLARAMRMDKLSLAALEATLRLYLDPAEAVDKIPVLRMLCASRELLQKKAEHLYDVLNAPGETAPGVEGFRVEVVNLPGQAGGGAMPEEALPSAGIAITHPDIGAVEIERQFRMGTVPIVGRINQEQFLLDIRTVEKKDFIIIAKQYNQLKLS